MTLKISFDLAPNAGLKGVNKFHQLDRVLQEIAALRAGSGPAAQARQAEIRNELLKGKSLSSLIRLPADFRHVVTLWRNDTEFFELAPPTFDLLSRVLLCVGPQSTSQLRQLCQLFFERFDQIEPLGFFGNRLRQLLFASSRYPKRSKQLRVYQAYADLLFDPAGPMNLAARCVAKKTDIAEEAREHHISTADACRFFSVSRYGYYLEKVKRLPLGAPDPIFEHLRKPAVYQVPYQKNLTLGHAVAMLLMDRVGKAGISDEWRDVVIAILGDPRVPRHSSRYQLGWGRLDPEYARRMRQWLSGYDLKVFLRILDEMSTARSMEAMERMFPPRKRFLEGLYDHGYIEDSRLLLSRKAVRYLESMELVSKPRYIAISEAYTTLIYLNVRGVHLVEGTHSWAARVFRSPADVQPILDAEEEGGKAISLDEVRRWNEAFSIRHHPPITWQKQLIDAFADLGVAIDPEHVLSPADYQKLKRQFGTPSRRGWNFRY